jgi:Resolvase, N terminal domain
MSFHPHTGGTEQGPEPGRSSNTVLVRLGKRKVEIDKTIAPIVMDLWKAGLLNVDDGLLPPEQAAGNAVHGYARASTDRQENSVKVQKADVENRFADERCKDLRRGRIFQDPEASSARTARPNVAFSVSCSGFATESGSAGPPPFRSCGVARLCRW